MIRISKGLLIAAVVAVMMLPTAAFADPPGVAEPRETVETTADEPQQDFRTLETTDIADVIQRADSNSDIERKINELEQKINAVEQKVDEGHSHIFLIIGLILNLLLTIALCCAHWISKGDIRRQRSKIDELVKQVQNTTALITDLETALKAQRSEREENLSDLRAELSRLKPESTIASAPRPTPVNQPSSVNRPTPVNRPSPARQLATADQNAELTAIIGAFQTMTSALKASPWDSNAIKTDFAQKYGVVTFRCINSSERVNRPELPPEFAESNLNDGTFWGVPLSTNGALLVFPKPGLSDYESGRHYQGGFKELFDVPYSGGNYRKIDVELPAVMTRDFKILKQGKLNLGS